MPYFEGLSEKKPLLSKRNVSAWLRWDLNKGLHFWNNVL